MENKSENTGEIREYQEKPGGKFKEGNPGKPVGIKNYLTLLEEAIKTAEKPLSNGDLTVDGKFQKGNFGGPGRPKGSAYMEEFKEAIKAPENTGEIQGYPNSKYKHNCY